MNTTAVPNAILAYCRPGYEKECGAELTAHLQSINENGFFTAKQDAGFIVWKRTASHSSPLILPKLSELIFTRQLVSICSEPIVLPEADRATPLAASLKNILPATEFFELFVESPDTNSGKELSRFCKSLTPPILKACEAISLRKNTQSTLRLHVFLTDSKAAYVGFSELQNSSRWEQGIIRLKFPPAAPSRSTLKLEEAFHTFLAEDERQHLLQPGMRAVDLGAAPGGWTYQFVKRKMKVTAVDNGKLDKALLDSGLVTVSASNGLTYTPHEPVDWLVCDMIETPLRVCETALRWFQQGNCERAVITLKLPMKKRLEEVQMRVDELTQKIKAINSTLKVAAKHLYHNRDEITVYIG